MGDRTDPPAITPETARPRASRRDVLRMCVMTGVAVLGGSRTGPPAARAADAVSEHSPQFEAAYAKLTGDSEPKSGPIKLELPDIAENGNMVPFSLSIDSPMTADSYVQTLTLFSTGNPQPVIATFTFTPLSGRAVVSGRLRLARTQDLIAVAQLSTGERIKGTTRVEVTVGGCGAS